jgi:hypothetical protein
MEQMKTATEMSRAVRGELDWESPTDPANPQNWPLWQRIFATTVPALQCLVM